MNGNTPYLNRLLSGPRKRIKVPHDVSPLIESTMEGIAGPSDHSSIYDMPITYAPEMPLYQQPAPVAWFEDMPMPVTPVAMHPEPMPEMNEPQVPVNYESGLLTQEMFEMFMEAALIQAPEISPTPVQMDQGLNPEMNIAALEEMVSGFDLAGVSPTPSATDEIEQEIQQITQEPGSSLPEAMELLSQIDPTLMLVDPVLMEQHMLMPNPMMMPGPGF